MPRSTNSVASRARRKKVLKLARGYRERKHSTFRAASEQLLHSMSYAYRDRRNKKRDFRRLWIARINAAARANGVRYSEFIHWLNKANITLDRKVLAELAIRDPEGFGRIVEQARAAQA
jgi:large subunit ribosomal protein L20